MVLKNIKWVIFLVLVLKDTFQISIFTCIYMCDTSSMSNSSFVMVWVDPHYGRGSQIFAIIYSVFPFSDQTPFYHWNL